MCKHAVALRDAEDELQDKRGLSYTVAAFIHNPAYDLEARIALARSLGLPEPTDRR